MSSAAVVIGALRVNTLSVGPDNLDKHYQVGLNFRCLTFTMMTKCVTPVNFTCKRKSLNRKGTENDKLEIKIIYVK